MSRMPENIEMARPMEAQEYFIDTQEQLDHLLVGERDAKVAAAVAWALPSDNRNVVFVAGTGTGKTALSREMPYLVEEVTRPVGDDDASRQVVHFDTRSDLSTAQLTGGQKTSYQQVNGHEAVRTITQIEGMLDPEETVVLVSNEINRTSPDVVNTALELYENRLLEVDGRIVRYNGLQLGIANMNPGERRNATFPVSLATASRFMIGAVMGEDPKSVQARREAIFLNNFTPKPVEPTTSFRGLDRIRNRARYGVDFLPEQVGHYSIDLIDKTTDVFRKNGINENGGRVETHLKEVAMTLAALRGKGSAEKEDVRDSARFIVTAIVGMLSTKAVTDVQNVVEQIGIQNQEA